MSQDKDGPTEVYASEPAPELAGGSALLCLMVLSGPDKGASHKLSREPMVLGRSTLQADLAFNGPGVSRAHARVEVGPENTVTLVDLNSTNGLFVNGERVTEATLRPGDSVGLGPEVVLRLDLQDEASHEVLRELYQGATSDELTGILNRRSFLKRLHEEHAALKRHGWEACIALIDADHFKKVNDTHGHPAGDAVLVELARRLAAGVRTEDVVGRYGGEEFILLIRQSGLEGATRMLERIRSDVEGRAFRVPTSEGELAIPVTVSVGVAELAPDREPDSSIAAADQALYRAKAEGRNRVRFDSPSRTG